jgi:DMSO/TMAO reductase YedYZ molybdopterin-dependent catalytic subunit
MGDEKKSLVDDKNAITRRGLMMRLFAGAAVVALGGCERLSGSAWFPKVLSLGEKATYRIQRLVVPRKAMAEEFTAADLSPQFRSNGTDMPSNPTYVKLAARQFVQYRLEVVGLVERPMWFSLDEVKRLPCRTQITRHDCVEGWSSVGKWKGARLSALLEAVRVKPAARYVVFHCADPMEADPSSLYYESVDLEDAFHPQTILAYELNDLPLPIKNGAPLRLRIERQLGYKMAKYVMAIEVVDDLSKIAGGKGGYWEDRGYEWYAGV